MSRVEDPRAARLHARCDLCVCLSTKLSACLSVCRPRGPGMRMWPWRMRHGPPRPRGPGVSGVRVSTDYTARCASNLKPTSFYITQEHPKVIVDHPENTALAS